MTLLRDTRGVAAVEFGIIASAMIGLLLPITDIGVAAMRYSSAYQALRSVGAYALYNPPPNLTDLSKLRAMLPAGQDNTVITVCGDTLSSPVDCPAGGPSLPPRSFVFSTKFKLNPIIFDVGCKEGCTVTYLERFQ